MDRMMVAEEMTVVETRSRAGHEGTDYDRVVRESY